MVIGGGSGGSTVAGRLSEDKKFSVLLVEAGLDEPVWTKVPSFFFNYLHSDIDWQYQTESEEHACLNKKDKKCYWGRGKVFLSEIFIQTLTGTQSQASIRINLNNFDLEFIRIESSVLDQTEFRLTRLKSLKFSNLSSY